MKKGHHQYFTKKCESKQLNKVHVTIKKQFCVTSSPISEHLRGDVTTSPWPVYIGYTSPVSRANWADPLSMKYMLATILVTNLETIVWFLPSLMLISVLQSSQCSKIRVAQHWGRRGPHLSENKGVKSECKKSVESLRQMAPVSTICDEDHLCLSRAWTGNKTYEG